MTTKIQEVCAFLEQIAPLNLQESYDNAGLITGHPDWDIKSVLISLDATEAVIDEAISIGANLVISHHPIVFRGLKTFNGNHYVDRAIIKVIKNDIALYAIHTNLDNVLNNGVNQKIAEKIGLINCHILSPKSLESELIGAGLFGSLQNELSLEDLLKQLKIKMNTGSIKHTVTLGNKIQTVALCGGSGSFLIPQAIAKKADVFITADLKYHEFFEANDKIVLIDIGHYESEQFTIDLLFGLISGKFPNFASHCTKMNTNPVQYY
ncbi:MAG: Nif3-like dinuclear metal center hexameric protein [Saprospiraceae bacterium]